MTEQTTPETRLWTPTGFREDEWAHAESAEALSGNGRFILPLQAFLGLDPEVRRSAKERLGVALQPGEDARSGRWAGHAKTECGIHLSGLEKSLTDASL